MPENESYLKKIVSRSNYCSLASLKFPFFSVFLIFLFYIIKRTLGTNNEKVPDVIGILLLIQAYVQLVDSEILSDN